MALHLRAGSRLPGHLRLLLAVALGFTTLPAHAQNVSMTAEPSLGGYYKPHHWLPISVWLDNQGQPADVEISAEMKDYGGPTVEYRLPVEQLPAPARRRYTLYVLPPLTFSTRPVEVQLLQGRRVVAQQTITVRPLNDGDRMVAVLDNEEGLLNAISGMSIPTRRQGSFYGGPQYPGAPGSRFGRPGQPRMGQAQVAYLRPDECPDRLKGLDAVDVLVVGNVSAKDLSDGQRKAIAQWVQTGGTLVITGGANPGRLAEPFFRDLLPVQVAGTVTIPRLVGMQNFSLKQAPATGPLVITSATARPVARTWATADGARLPLVVEGRAGSGRVFFTAFDLKTPAVRLWDGAPEMWRKILSVATAEPSLLSQIETRVDPRFGGRWPQRSRIGNACHELSQLDPPKFAYIGLFLLSYVIVLVPVNYYVLKQRDKKEYAWVTTPAIVLIFSVLAYLVGYGMKGGQVLLAKVGVVEASTGSPMGAAYHYLGLFSPRKTEYDVALPDAEATLSEWRDESGATPRPITIAQSEPFRAEEMSVDMWSMRILRAENAVPLGKGIVARLRRSGQSVSGTITNSTPYDLENCQVVSGTQAVRLGRIERGATRPLAPVWAGGGGSNQLASAALFPIRGNEPLDRMKRAMLQPLTAFNPTAPSIDHPVLIGWVMQPLVKVTVNGRTVREQNVSLFLVHLR